MGGKRRKRAGREGRRKASRQRMEFCRLVLTLGSSGHTVPAAWHPMLLCFASVGILTLCF